MRPVRPFASHAALALLLPLVLAAGCARGAAPVAVSAPPSAASTPPSVDGVSALVASPEPGDERRSIGGPWIGASAEGALLAKGTRDTFVGVWIDVPSEKLRPERRAPMEVALVVDTSGSMKGSKIESAREGAATLVRSLRDGDIVALDAFSDEAQTIVPPTALDAASRREILRQIEGLVPTGSTNLFAGLTLAQSQIARAPATHTVRRIVVLSDGIANRGPSTPELLGSVARQGQRFGAQITSLGIGIDYDERTLNALSVQTNGRLYHVDEPRETAAVLASELALIDGTLASDAFVEIVGAPGVTIVDALGLPGEAFAGGLRIPLGALHAGQHREALVRVRLTDPAAFEGGARSLASVRLRFRDAAEGGLERIQEVVARTQISDDAAAVARAVDTRTRGIVAMHEASDAQIAAAQRINDGNFEAAEKDLARAQQALVAQASTVTDKAEKRRLERAAESVAGARVATRAMPSKSKSDQRAGALKLNASAMHDAGY